MSTMTVDDARHGTPAGHVAHRRAGQDPCDPCRAAQRLYDRARRLDEPRSVPVDETAALLRELIAAGWPFALIEKRLGLGKGRAHKLAQATNPSVYTATATAVATLHAELRYATPPQTTRLEKWHVSYARTTALRNGWTPPPPPPVTAATIEEKFCGCHPYMPNEWNAEGYVCMGCGWPILYGHDVPLPARRREPAPLHLVETPDHTLTPVEPREDAA